MAHLPHGLGTVKAGHHNKHTQNQDNIFVGEVPQRGLGRNQPGEHAQKKRRHGGCAHGNLQLIIEDIAENHGHEDGKTFDPAIDGFLHSTPPS